VQRRSPIDSGAGHVKQIRPLCPTRWLVRVKAIGTVLSEYEPVLQCLEELAVPGSALASKASGLQHQLCKASTLLSLEMALRVFTPLETLNKALQSSYQTVGGMLNAVDEVKAELTAMRTSSAFDSLLDDVTERQERLDLVPVDVPRQRRPPRRFTGPASSHAATSVSDHYRPIFFGLLDSAITQLTERFTGDGLTRYSQLEKVLLTGDVTEHQEMLSQYPEVNVTDLTAQLRMFRRTRPTTSVSDAATALRQMLPEVRAEYDQVSQLVKLLMVSPASSAQAERSFSALRRLKTWLRTSMTEVRMNSVAVCHCHQQLIDALDIKPLLREFVSRSDLRMSLFGRVV